MSSPLGDLRAEFSASDEPRVNAHRDLVRGAFERADRYDAHASVQWLVANALALRIGALPLGPEPRVLEVGCGTGFLADAAAERIGAGDWLMTDVAPAMLDRSRTRLGHDARFRFATLDGEHPIVSPSEPMFDLICSSLAVQWFGYLQAGLSRLVDLLRPGGFLCVSTLVAGTLAEWVEAHAQAGETAGTPRYPTAGELRAMELRGAVPDVTVERYVDTADDPLALMRKIRAIGAGTPRRGHRPLSPASVRTVLRALEASGCAVTYQVAFCMIQVGRD